MKMRESLTESPANGCHDQQPKEIKMLRKQLEIQSGFCSLMGSVMSNMLWDLSKCPHIACTLAHKSRVEELLEVVRSTILCYAAACCRNREAWPAGLSTDETRLAVSLAGLTANIAAVEPSMMVCSGRKLLKDAINVLLNLPADPLKKVLLELLYNVSLDEVGAALLLEKAVVQVIKRALYSGPEIRLSALKLLASLTSRPIPPTLMPQMPFEQVRTLYHTGDTEMSHYASMVLKKITPFMED